MSIVLHRRQGAKVESLPLKSGDSVEAFNWARQAGFTVWVEAVSTTPEEWQMLGEVFMLHPLALEDAMKQNQRPKVDQYGEYLYLPIRYYSPSESEDEITISEIDVFIGQGYIITSVVEPSEIIEKTRQRLARNEDSLSQHPSFLLYLLIDEAVDSFFPKFEKIGDQIEAIEGNIFSARPLIDTNYILVLKRQLLLLRRTIGPIREASGQLLRLPKDSSLIDHQTHLYLQDTHEHALRLVEQIDHEKEIIVGVMQAQMGLSNQRLNEVMKQMTAISTIIMSATLVAGIYGMNFQVMPELNWRYGYPIAMLLMLVISLILWTRFKKNGWL